MTGLLYFNWPVIFLDAAPFKYEFPIIEPHLFLNLEYVVYKISFFY